jgi:hypothetical protein
MVQQNLQFLFFEPSTSPSQDLLSRRCHILGAI